ncbi:MAG: YceI family protein, partial [Saprospiraceae bacterium]
AVTTADTTTVATVPATPVGTAYTISKGTINWTGAKPTGKHTGTIAANSGIVYMDKGHFSGGDVAIDMNSLAVTDLKDKKKADLEGHLKAGDFFETDKFPTAAFKITNCTAIEGNPKATHEVTGNLTLKGITKEVKFPVMVTVADKKLTAKSEEFTINRTDWGVKYASGIIGTAKDKLIDDNVKLMLELEAMAN